MRVRMPKRGKGGSGMLDTGGNARDVVWLEPRS